MGDLPRFADLTLVLTEQCNLRCAYCYVPKTQKTMSEAAAMRAVDFFVDRAAPTQPLSLSFFGGEPFIARPLMARVMARARARGGERVRFTTPTNATLLDDEAMTLVRDSGLQLALSLDGTADSADRPDARGVGSLRRVRPRLADLRALDPIVRMTVTPENVAHLCDNVVALFGWGFARIMHQPALEQPWPDEAQQRWVAEHRRLGQWLCDRYAARQPIPDLITLEGIAKRLSGQRQGSCGAGVSQAAVDTEGRVFGCYRSVYDPRAERLVLGHIDGGPVNETLLATYARLHASRALPERGSCSSCDARAGCTCYCPAMGHALLGDLRAVSERACALMRPQVAIVADTAARMARLDRARRRRTVGRVAAAALALGLSMGNTACGSRAARGNKDAQVERARDGIVGGVCPIQVEAGPRDSIVAGVCPVQEAGSDATPRPDALGPGLCAVRPDASRDIEGPGLCPISVDQGPTKLDSNIGPGLCPVPGLC